jgi:HEAT repeat protein
MWGALSAAKRGLILAAMGIVGVAILANCVFYIRSLWPKGLNADIARSRSPVQGERLSACDALVRYDNEPERSSAAVALIDLLSDQSPMVRAAAAQSLAKLRYKAAGPHLLSLLGDPNDGVASAAAFALASLSDENGYRALHGAALAGRSLMLRAAAAEAIGMYRRAASTKTLHHVLQHDRSPYVRRSAVRGLAQIGTPEALDAIREVEHRDDIDGAEARDALHGR